jgi:hypothetical protein
MRDKYDSNVNYAGLDRSIETATKARAAADSAAEKNRPESAVPIGKKATSGADSAKGAEQPR